MSPAPWHWLALGGALLVAEALTPGVAFLWLALAAAATAGLAWLVPSSGWQAQVLGFALAAVASVGCWSWWRRRWPAQAADPGLNRRAKSYVGSRAVLVAGIDTGHGRVRVGDTTWAAAGPRLPEGTPVRIVGSRGAVLLVAPLAPTGAGSDGGAAASDDARGSPRPG
ncbi:MAG TPA: NfeD family protein [Geminicoccaceae bacterium]|nr:NfeD family protein [Geminicoccaceae bacterium]